MKATKANKVTQHSGSAMSADAGLSETFHHFSEACAHAVGSSWTFVLALGVVLVWAITGPMFDYSDTWQLLINTGTTIVTFLMVFLIQNAQNRDAQATQLKLDELIRAVKGTRKQMMDAEDLSDQELSRLKEEFARMGEHPDDPVRQRLRRSLGRGAVARTISSTVDVQEQPRPAVAAQRRERPAQRQHEEYTRPLRASQRQWT